MQEECTVVPLWRILLPPSTAQGKRCGDWEYTELSKAVCCDKVLRLGLLATREASVDRADDTSSFQPSF